MTSYRIEELAEAANTTVRNIRAYQDRGILPAPRREGRIAWYSDSHLARLRIVGALLERAYSIANIAELLETWEKGSDLGALLGFEDAITSPFTDEEPVLMTPSEVLEMFGSVTPAQALRAIQLGLGEWRGGNVHVPSPRLIRAGAELVRVGVPNDVMLDELAKLRADIDRITERFLDIVTKYVIQDDRPAFSNDASRLAEIIRRIRPLAATIVTAQLAQAMEKKVRARLGERFGSLFLRSDKKP